jgi:hypothetical protein
MSRGPDIGIRNRDVVRRFEHFKASHSSPCREVGKAIRLAAERHMNDGFGSCSARGWHRRHQSRRPPVRRQILETEMIKGILAASALIGALVVPLAAQAQDYRFEGGRGGYQDGRGGYGGPRDGYRDGYRGERPRRQPLSTRELYRAVRSQGYRDIDVIRDRRDVSIVRAVARGREWILVVDAYSGDILRRRVVDNGWRRDRGWHGGWGDDWRRW